jgi:hypothetical protein
MHDSAFLPLQVLVSFCAVPTFLSDEIARLCGDGFFCFIDIFRVEVD